jgi:LysM repeat protein
MYKIKAFLITVCILFTSVLWAQQDLSIQGASPGLYLSHTVAANQTWYSIGRLYNVTPKEVASFNKTTIESKLSIGQQLKIPLIAENFSQDGVRATDEVFVPLYHTVQDKEWMYRISQNNNKIPIETLEKWNGITNGQLKPGMKLVVGYLKVKTGQSALAARGSKKITTITAAPPVAKNETPLKADPVVVKNDPPVTKNNSTVVKNETPVEVKKPESKEVVNPPLNNSEEPPAQPTVKQTAAEANPTETSTYNGAKGGYFRNGFSENGKNATGNAGVFRSTSGWKDGKYYALMNDVPIGTIIKVTFPSTSKSVYAKVLGELPEMRESVGLTIRLSDAAAAELGAELGKFYVDVKY